MRGRKLRVRKGSEQDSHGEPDPRNPECPGADGGDPGPACQCAQQLADLQAKQTDRGVVVTLGDVLFDTGQATLKPGRIWRSTDWRRT